MVTRGIKFPLNFFNLFSRSLNAKNEYQATEDLKKGVNERKDSFKFRHAIESSLLFAYTRFWGRSESEKVKSSRVFATD